jgi:hypothetical protein
MACPTCDHTMQSAAQSLFWCPRCGTLKDTRHGEPPIDVSVPKLVERCHKLLTTIQGILYVWDDNMDGEMTDAGVYHCSSVLVADDMDDLASRAKAVQESCQLPQDREVTIRPKAKR